MTVCDTARRFRLSRRKLLAGALASLVPQAALADQTDDPYPLPAFDYKKLPKDFPPHSRRLWRPPPARHDHCRHVGPATLSCARGQAGDPLWLRGRQGRVPLGRARRCRTKVIWPRWTPPKEMIERNPEKANWADGMPGGPDNPLGARALYLSRTETTRCFESMARRSPCRSARMHHRDVFAWSTRTWSISTPAHLSGAG